MGIVQKQIICTRVTADFATVCEEAAPNDENLDFIH
jgi:hypothetical protein